MRGHPSKSKREKKRENASLHSPFCVTAAIRDRESLPLLAVRTLTLEQNFQSDRSTMEKYFVVSKENVALSWIDIRDRLIDS